MKNIYNYINCLLLIFLLSACSNNDLPFNGTDANIVSFSLNINGIEYPATITENKININVPKNTDISNIKANIKLSENATIQPDPQTITNWEEEQIFRVQSWNGDYTSYKFNLNKTDIVNEDNVELLTQSDVNLFASKQINSIKGNLIIGNTTSSDDSITDLSPLYNLTSVSYNVVIRNGFSAKNLEGLEGLKNIGGLYIGTEDEKSSNKQKISISLPSVQSLNNLIINSDSITSISLPSLKKAGEIFINSTKLSNIDLSRLELCSGDINIRGSKGMQSENNSNIELKELNLQSLKEVLGTMTVENFWKINKLTIPSLEKVYGSFNINFVRGAVSISIPKLTSVNGKLNIYANDGMKTFSSPSLKEVQELNIASYNAYSINLKKIDLPNLEKVYGTLNVNYFGGINIDLPKLSQVNDKLNLSRMQFVESINTPALKLCHSLYIESDPSLKSFDASSISDLTELKIGVCNELTMKLPETISGNVTLTKVWKELSGLKKIGGKLTISSYANTTLSLPDIEEIGTYYQTCGTNLENLSLPQLKNIGDIMITNLPVLTTLSMPKLETANNITLKGLLLVDNIEFGKLATIENSLLFYGSSYAYQASKSKTTNLNGFSSLTKVQEIDIRYAGNLSDFSGLKNVINSLSPEKWSVQSCKYNPTYQDMKDAKYKED